MTVRYYSSVASEKTLTGTITSGQTTLQVSNTIGLPGLFPYTIAVDYETATEELVEVSSAAGTTLTVVRGIDGTSGTSHTSGARVRHVTSARDFADSRNHENSSTGVHGLAPSEALVGTDSAQTLSNKTLVDAQGTLKNIDVTLVPPNATTFTATPAGTDTSTAINLVNGSAETLNISYGGGMKVRNTVAMDTATTTRRISSTMSDGTTERFALDATGMATTTPRSGTANTFGGFKTLDPGDDITRKMIQMRNSGDTLDRFVVRGTGSTEITLSNNSQVVLNLKGAAAMGASYLRVVDSADVEQLIIDSGGRLNALFRARVQNSVLPGSSVFLVQGHATQTGFLTRWENSLGTELAHVAFDGSADFAPTVTSTGIIVPAAGWSINSQVCVTKAGVATFNLQMQRTGGNITPNAAGDITTDPPLGTLNAAFRPNAAFGSPAMPFPFTNDVGDGIAVMNPSTGDMNLTTYSTGGTLNTGSTVKVWMSYPL